MSLRRYQSQHVSQLKIQLRPLQPNYNGNINGDVRPQTRSSTAVNLEEPASGERTSAASSVSSITTIVPAEATSSTATSAIPPGSGATTDAPVVTEQIANLLNLAQHLLSSVREQQQQQQQHRHRHRHRRESRLQASTPYQRSNSTPLQAAQRHNDSDDNAFGINGTNVNTVSSIGGTCAITNGNANSTVQQHSGQTQFHNGGSNNNNSNNNTNSRASEDNINFQCSICLESYLLHRPMVTQCGHIFCKRCIMQCVSCQSKCPMCNRKLNSNSMFRVYF